MPATGFEADGLLGAVVGGSSGDEGAAQVRRPRPRRWRCRPVLVGAGALTAIAATAAFLDGEVPSRAAPSGARDEAGSVVGFDSTPATTAQLCTDGWDFEFSVGVEYAGHGSADLITTGSGALSLNMSDETQAPGFALLELVVDTLSFGSVAVRLDVNTSQRLRTVHVKKEVGSVCLSYASVAGEEQACTYRPASLPGLGFQLAPPGVLRLSTSKLAKVTDFVQTAGTIPVSFSVQGPQFLSLWQNESEWASFTSSATSALRDIAGAGASMVDAFGVANLAGDVYFQGSVISAATPGMACQVEGSIAMAIRDGTFRAQVAERVKAAQLTNVSSPALAAHAAVPAVPMLCKQVTCRYAEHRDVMMEAKCLGALCFVNCCEKSWGLGIMPPKTTPLTLQDLGLNASMSPALPVLPPSPSTQPAQSNTTTIAQPAPMAPTAVDVLLASKGALKDKLNSDTSVVGNPLYKPVGTLFTDGVDLSLGLILGLNKRAWDQESIIITSALGAMSLKALKGDGKGSGFLSFEGALLGGRSCVVQSEPLLAGWVVAKEYTVRLSKDAEQCCIETTPIPDLGSSHKVCSKKVPGDVSFQLLPVVDIVGSKALTDIEIKDFVQTSGSITMSFSIAGLSFEKLTTSCNCLDNLKMALEESISFAAGLGISQSQVSVAILRGAAWAGSAANTSAAAGAPTSAAMPVPPTSHEARDWMIGQEKLKQLLNGSSIFELDYDGKPEATQVLGANLSTQAQAEMMGKLEDVLDIGSGHRRLALVGAAGASLIAVQATVQGCGGSCAAVRASLMSAVTDGLILQRAARVTGDGPTGKATVAAMAVQYKSCPGNPSKCSFFTCPAFTVNADPLRTCYGAGCQETCCRPVTCSKVTCGKGMLRKLGADPGQVCTDSADCADRCCLQVCADYDCQSRGEGMCPRNEMSLSMARPSEAKHRCCQRQHCCDAPTSWCISCRRCISQKSFCRSLLWKWMPRPTKRLRRLSGSRRQPAASDRVASPVGELSDDEALADLLPGAASPEETAADAEEAARIIRGTIGHLREQARRLSVGEASRRLGAASERVKFLETLEEQRREALALLLAATRSSKMNRTGDGFAELRRTWGNQWNEVVLQSKAADGGHMAEIVGCAPHVEVPCMDYQRTAVFMHHSGCKQAPHFVNTVQILTDTEHAVSCGNDAVCFVWKIRSGTAVQAYFSDDPEHRGRIHTVSVMDDAAMILSAGENKNKSTGGRAFMWDWLRGTEKESLACEHGYFLSSAELPIWRTSLLGCSSGHTYIWAWGDGEELKLPYYKRSAEEVIEAIKDRLESYFTDNLNGWERWAISNQIRSHTDFREWVKTISPGIEMDESFWAAVDKFYEHRSMGKINGIAYVPACQRFVTATSDGKVRYWNSDTGEILRCMGGQHGSMNAVAALPVKLQAVSGGADGFGRLWDLETGKQLLAMHFPGVSAPINAVAVFPGGDRVAFGHEDGFVRIWKLNEGTPLCSIDTGSAVRDIAINPSNPMGQIITANADGYAWVFTPKA